MAGRPRSERLSKAAVAGARRRIEGGESVRAVARELGVAHSTLAARIRAASEEDTRLASVGEAGSEHVRVDDSELKAVDYVERLEATYQEAFRAIETLVEAIERVQELRRREEPRWEQARNRGCAPPRPEPWHLRTLRSGALRELSRRFDRAIHSPW